MFDQDAMDRHVAELRPLTLRDREKLGGLAACTELRQWIAGAIGSPRGESQIRALRWVFGRVISGAQVRLRERGYKERKKSDTDCLIAGIAETLVLTERTAFDALIAADPGARRIYEARIVRGQDSEAARKLRMAIWTGNGAPNTGHHQTEAGLVALLKASDQLLDSPEQVAALLQYLKSFDRGSNASAPVTEAQPLILSGLDDAGHHDAPASSTSVTPQSMAPDQLPTTRLSIDNTESVADDEPEPTAHSLFDTALSWFHAHKPHITRTALRIGFGLVPPLFLGLLVLFANLLPPSTNATFWAIHRWLIENFLLESVLLLLAGPVTFVVTFLRLWVRITVSLVLVVFACAVILFPVAGGILYETETRAGESLATSTRRWPSTFSDDFDSARRCQETPPPPAEDSLERRYSFECFIADGALHMTVASGETISAEGYLVAANIPLLREAFVETVYRAERDSTLASCGVFVGSADRQLFVRLRPVHTADLRHAEPLTYYVAEVLEVSRPPTLPFEAPSGGTSAKVITTSSQLGFVDRKAVWGADRSRTLLNLEVTANRIAVYVERRKVLDLEHAMTELRVAPGVLADTPLTVASCTFDYLRTRVQPA